MSNTTEYGTLTDYQTGEAIRPATKAELEKSIEAGDTGVFDLDGRSVWVG